MAKSKKLSKRITCRRRHKIEKKVREHNRKLRKEMKKTRRKSTKTKEVVVPSKHPFKEDLLREAQRQKNEAVQSMEKKRKLKIAVKASKKLSRTVGDLKHNRRSRAEGTDEQPVVAWKDVSQNFCAEVKKVIELADVIIEVLDARDPLGSRCYQFEQSVLAMGKRLVLLLNKIDLIPKTNVEKWLKYLRNELPTLAFKASTQEQRTRLGVASKYSHGTGTSKCIGSDLVMSLLANYCRNQDIKTSIRVGIIGFPNVGKSSVINSLKRSRSCNVGAVPGVTRSLQEVELDKKIRLIDTPGVVLAQTSHGDVVEAALKNAVRIEALEDPVAPVEAILRRCTRDAMMLQYTIAEFETVNEFLALLARKMGRLKKGGVPDVNAAAKHVLNDWNTGKIRYYTEPPENQQLPSYISAEIVSELGQAFSIDDVDAQQRVIIDSMTPTTILDAPLVSSSGPLSLVLDSSDSTHDAAAAMDTSDGGEETTVKYLLDKPTDKSSATRSSSDVSGAMAAEMNLEGNLQSGKRLKSILKKQKKKTKRSDKIASSLSESLCMAMDTLVDDDTENNDDAYSFDEQFS